MTDGQTVSAPRTSRRRAAITVAAALLPAGVLVGGVCLALPQATP